MKSAVLGLLIGLCVTANALTLEQDRWMKGQVHGLKRELKEGNLTALAYRSDLALDQIISLSLSKLHEAGDDAFAAQKHAEWEGLRGYLTRMMTSRDIGDHAPLIAWLAVFYDHIEAVLGVKMCKELHLSDIKTFNYTIPVVFKPCTFPMDAVTVPRGTEYKEHFAVGAVYYGLVPVVTYWTINIGCMVLTNGAGAMWACGPIADASEWFMGKVIAPHLSDLVFSKACPAVEVD